MALVKKDKLKGTNTLAMSAGDSFECPCVGSSITVINHGAGDIWLSTEGEAAVNGEYSLLMPSNAAFSFKVNNAGNTIFLYSVATTSVGVAVER